ncbi:CYTH-like domain-containing protein [Boeremia exigua]|uniref:CYTH-like domain-containing protein n=1 Tax=Boeremia exigua TaxID=749465 RepID=UPI001E8CAD22|nr:CYTH-like domain-containing protein [Boeremia exigua]KAH6618685.1 CYTH-like domain-containing protein [Boeremia exigua]
MAFTLKHYMLRHCTLLNSLLLNRLNSQISCSTKRFRLFRPVSHALMHRFLTSAAVAPQTHTLEVERKFVPSSPAISLLKSKNLWPGSETIEPMTSSHGLRFTDTYFDTSRFTLRDAGIYVRLRNDEWELKIRRTGGMVSTGCIEVLGRTHVEALLKDESIGVSLLDLEQVAKMKTVRTAWKIGDFTVSVDDTTLLLRATETLRGTILEIPHSVGEVELCKEVVEEEVEQQMQNAVRQIDQFMNRNEEVFKGRFEEFCPQVPEGKLAAFFRWEEMLRQRRFFPLRWHNEERRFVPVSQIRGEGAD